MKQSSDPRLKILIATFVIAIVGGIIAGIVLYQNEESAGIPQLEINPLKYDFGKVSMANGLVSHNFEIENKGTGDLKISSIRTSCMCTIAVLEVERKRSPVFGMHNNPTIWSQKIKPGQAASVEVTFDPNAHGPNATGPITREVIISSNDGNKESVQTKLTITANVVK